jgi:uncharacterized tellurite resistance protein B-like protein
MNTQEEKLNLLSEMIAFAVVDGKLHDRELMFLKIVAVELKINANDFNDLFHTELKIVPNKSEFQRVQQFYRLALLMHCDGVLHEKEQIKIHEIGVNMGLNPYAIKRVLKIMNGSDSKMMDPEQLLEIFQEQHN